MKVLVTWNYIRHFPALLHKLLYCSLWKPCAWWRYYYLLLQPVTPLLECICSKLILYHLFSFDVLRLSPPLNNLNSLLKQDSTSFLFFLGKLLLQIASLSFKKKGLYFLLQTSKAGIYTCKTSLVLVNASLYSSSKHQRSTCPCPSYVHTVEM